MRRPIVEHTRAVQGSRAGRIRGARLEVILKPRWDDCRPGLFSKRVTTMNDQANALDQADEEILTYTVSDEALEAAAGTERGAPSYPTSFCGGFC
jgi:hypothetical protein